MDGSFPRAKALGKGRGASTWHQVHVLHCATSAPVLQRLTSLERQLYMMVSIQLSFWPSRSALTPALLAISRATCLREKSCMVEPMGPSHTTPASVMASMNDSFSDRKP